jgi:hypothetical protein
VLEDVLVQLAQRLRRLDAELLDEPSARGLVGRQGVGLSSRAIERQHLQLHEALLEGMLDDQRFEVPQQLAVATQLEVDLDPLDDRAQALLCQPRPLRGEQAVNAHSRERLSTPDTERLLDPRASELRLIGRTRFTSLAECVLPVVDIALARPHVQQVAARLTDQPAAVGARLGQRLAQARDVHLQAVTWTRGRLLAPQLIDQSVSGHHPIAHERQDGEQRPRPLTSQRHGSAIETRLHRTEQLDLQPAGAVGHPRDHRVP